MIVHILKKIGRIFLMLTHEDRNINCGGIKSVLVISLASEGHLWRAIRSIKEKFKNANFKVILPDSKIRLVSDMIMQKDSIIVKSDVKIFEYIKQLGRFNGNEFGLIIVLSLNPFLVWGVFRKFKCPKLLYNNAGEWYLIRWRTFYEFLRGMIKSPYETICICIRIPSINIYLLSYAVFLSLRRYCYKLSGPKVLCGKISLSNKIS